MNRGLQRSLGAPPLRGVDPADFLGRPNLPFRSEHAASWHDHCAGTQSSVALVQNTLYATPFYNEPGNTIVGIGVLATATVSATWRIGVYSDNGMGVPDTLIWDSGVELPGTATAFVSVPCSIAEDGWIWLAVASHGANGALFITGNAAYAGVGGTQNIATGRSNGYSQTGITGVLPGIWGATLTDLLRVPTFSVDSRAL